jgi:hypothetical protein
VGLCRAATEPDLVGREDSSSNLQVLTWGDVEGCERWSVADRRGSVFGFAGVRNPGLACMRALSGSVGGIGALASDDLGVICGKRIPAADECEPGAVSIAEVDDHYRVFVEVHLGFDLMAGVDEFSAAEVTDEY